MRAPGGYVRYRHSALSVIVDGRHDDALIALAARGVLGSRHAVWIDGHDNVRTSYHVAPTETNYTALQAWFKEPRRRGARAVLVSVGSTGRAVVVQGTRRRGVR